MTSFNKKEKLESQNFLRSKNKKQTNKQTNKKAKQNKTVIFEQIVKNGIKISVAPSHFE